MPESNSFSEDEMEIMILHKFVKRGAWQDYHIYESDIPKGFPPRIRNGIMKAAKRLKREGLLIAFPHGNENVWILNKSRSTEIIERVKRFYPEEYA